MPSDLWSRSSSPASFAAFDGRLFSFSSFEPCPTDSVYTRDGVCEVRLVPPGTWIAPLWFSAPMGGRCSSASSFDLALPLPVTLCVVKETASGSSLGHRMWASLWGFVGSSHAPSGKALRLTILLQPLSFLLCRRCPFLSPCAGKTK